MLRTAKGLSCLLLLSVLLALQWPAAGQPLHRVVIRLASDSLPGTLQGPFFLAGTCNGWNPADSASRFSAIGTGESALTLWVKEGLLEFKITRGSWKQVEAAADGRAIANRQALIRGDTVLRLRISGWADQFTGSQPVHTRSAQVQILDTAFRIPQLNRLRRVWIYLPPDYHRSQKRYPVVYMQDGQNLFDDATAFSGEWGVDECLDTLGVSCIVVGIDHGGVRRMNEYAPFDMHQFGAGEGKQYAAFLVKVLKPYVDAHFRTRRAASSTFIAGSSMGGLISAYVLASYPQVVGGAGIFSPAFWVNPGIYQTLQAGQRRLRGPVFLYAGDTESNSMVSDLQKAASILEKRASGNIRVLIEAGGRHNETSWRSVLPAFFDWILRIEKN